MPAYEKGGLDQLVIPKLPQLFSMDVKQKINPKAFIFSLLHSFFIAARKIEYMSHPGARGRYTIIDTVV